MKLMHALVMMGLMAASSSTAFAVRTAECPDSLHVRVAEFVASTDQLDRRHSDFEKMTAAYEALDRLDSFELAVTLRQTQNGRCFYKGRWGSAMIYTSRGRNVLMVERHLVPEHEVNVRVYALISYLQDGELSIRKQGRYGAMAYFYMEPYGSWEGGHVVRGIGHARSFEVR